MEWLERKIGTPNIEKQIKGLPSIYGLARGLKDNKKASVAVTLSEEELSKTTFAGSLFAANPGVKGLPDTRFRGWYILYGENFIQINLC